MKRYKNKTTFPLSAFQSKYFAKKVVVGNDIFDSQKEYAFYLKLELQKKAVKEADRVLKIDRQVRMDCKVNDVLVCFYKADFKVLYADGMVKYYDVKGYRKGQAYQMFRLKKKLIKAIYNIDIEEV